MTQQAAKHRILHCIGDLSLEGGGPTRAVIDLSHAFARRGHTATCLTARAPAAPDAWKAPGANPSLVEMPGLEGAIRSIPADLRQPILDTLKRHDVLHFHGVWVPFYVPIATLARSIGMPYVLSVRGMLDDWCMEQKALKKRIYLTLGGSKLLKNAAAVHCTAEGERQQASRWFSPAPGIVIPNLLDMTPYTQAPDPAEAIAKYPALRSGLPVLLFLSRIHYKKGAEHAIRMIRALKDRGTPHHLIVAGTGDEPYVESLKRLVEHEGVGDLIDFVGLVSGTLKHSLYAACDLLAVPTSQENFGFIFYESLACGTPVLVTPGVDTWPELVGSGAGIKADQDPEALATVIAEATRDRVALRARGHKGREWVFNELNEDRIASAFEDVYDKARAQQ